MARAGLRLSPSWLCLLLPADEAVVAPPVPALDPSLEVVEPPLLPLSALGIRNIGG